jgi:hypothetical protein
VTPGLEKIQPPTAAPLKTLNDGKSAHSSGGSSALYGQRNPTLRAEAVRQYGNQQPPAQRSASITDELRFRTSKDGEDGGRKRKEAPSTSQVWRLHRDIQTMLRPAADADGNRKRGPSVCGCGYASLAEESVSIHVRRVGSRPQAFVTNVFRCGSPWLCPVCARRAAAKRQARVQKAAEATLARAGTFAHVVLTVRHTRAHALLDLKAAVADSSRAARSGRAWKALQAEMRAIGVLSAPEVTYSVKHGWHFHIHLAVLMLTGNVELATKGCNELVNRYLSELHKRGYTATWAGQHVNIAQDAKEAAFYVAKGLTWELTGSTTKNETRKLGSLTPFQIAELGAGGDARMRSLWQEYAAAMQGTRSCVITANISKALELQNGDDASEDEDADTDVCDVDKLGQLETITWNALLRHGYVPALFDRVESEPASNWPAIKCWADTVSREISPALRPLDIQTDEDSPPPNRTEIYCDVGPPRFCPHDRATDAALRAAWTVPAHKFIQREVQTMQRDWKRFGGSKPPTPAEIVAAIVALQVVKQSSVISRALERGGGSETMEAEERVVKAYS